MKDLFANLYNKVLSFFHQTETNNGSSAKDVACNRLKLVLMQDRTNLSPAIMERMRHELIDLLSKYLELDRELLDLNFEQEDEQMALMLSIPVIRAKDEEEIQELLRLEDEAAGVKEGVKQGVNDESNEEEDEEDSEDEEVSTEEESEETDSDDETQEEDESENDEEEENSEDTEKETSESEEK